MQTLRDAAKALIPSGLDGTVLFLLTLSLVGGVTAVLTPLLTFADYASLWLVAGYACLLWAVPLVWFLRLTFSRASDSRGVLSDRGYETISLVALAGWLGVVSVAPATLPALLGLARLVDNVLLRQGTAARPPRLLRLARALLLQPIASIAISRRAGSRRSLV